MMSNIIDKQIAESLLQRGQINSVKKVFVNCYSSEDGKYLWQGSCFENELLKTFEDCAKPCGKIKKSKWVKVLEKECKTIKTSHPQDKLHEIFDNHVYIAYEFAEKLNLFDVLMADVLIKKDNEIGRAMLELCSNADLRFIVCKKYYLDSETMEIDFEVCHHDNFYPCHNAMIKGEL